MKIFVSARKFLYEALLTTNTSTNSKIFSLDGLRGIASLLVLFAHIRSEGIALVPLNTRWNLGDSGVYLFFCLSSFLLTSSFLDKTRIKFNDYNIWIKYFSRRIFRIYPLYITMLLFAYIISTTGYDFLYIKNFKMIDIFKHLILINGKEFLWTIPIEFFYYLIIPFMAILFIIFSENIFAYIGVTLGIIFLNFVLYKYYPHILTHLPVFFMGSICAGINFKFSKIKNISRNQKLNLDKITLISLVAIVATVFINPLSDKPFLKALMFGILYTILMISHLHDNGATRKVFSNRIIRFFGTISFSTYLWHPFVIKLVNHLFESFLKDKFIYSFLEVLTKVFLIVFFTIFISFLSYFYVEHPFLFKPNKNIAQIE